MSSFLGILNVGGKVIYLVDWDKPVWFRAGGIKEDRIIPSLDYMLIDGLLFHSAEEFGILEDPFKEFRNKSMCVAVDDVKDQESLSRGREQVIASKKPWIMYSHFGKIDTQIAKDVSKLGVEVILNEISEDFANLVEF